MTITARSLALTAGLALCALTATGCGVLIGQESERNGRQDLNDDFVKATEFFPPGKAMYWSGQHVAGFHLLRVPRPQGQFMLGVSAEYKSSAVHQYQGSRGHQIIRLATYKGPTRPKKGADPRDHQPAGASFLTETDQLVLLHVYPPGSDLSAATVQQFRARLKIATRAAVAQLPEKWWEFVSP